MAIRIRTAATPGLDLFATLQQDIGLDGDIWSVTAGDWVSIAGVSVSDCKIDLAEDTAIASFLTGRYSAEITGTLGSYNGSVVVSIHDDNDSDLVIGTEIQVIQAGNPIDLSNVAPVPSPVGVVSHGRTWHLRDDGEFPLANQVLTLTENSTTTLAMDFGNLLNPQTDLASVATATVEVEAGIAPAIASTAISQDRRQAHITVSSTVEGSYVITATITTTDGQTLAGRGTLRVI